MSTLSKCPKCRQQVTVPDGFEREARVRCPLCEEEYPASEAMAEAPPALILVETVAASAAAEPEAAADEGPAIDVWQKVDAIPQIDTGAGEGPAAAIDTGQTPVDTEAFAAIAERGEEERYEPVDGTPTKRPPRKKKQKSMGRHLVEAIVGGFLGLTIGYYILCWVGGSRLDLPKLPLPFLPHTMGKPAEADNQDAQKPDEKPAGSARMEYERIKRRSKSQPKSSPPGGKKSHAAQPDTPPAEPPPTQPEPKAEPKSEAKPLPPDYVGPRNRPSVSSDDLGLALKAANDAIRGEEATGEITPDAYRQFCRAAHVLSFVEEGPQLPDRKLAIEDLLSQIAAVPGQIEEIARLAGSLLDREDREEDGILLAGTVRVVGIRDGLQAAIVRLAGLETEVRVMSKPPLPVEEGDQVLILGSIVVEPGESFVGYEGTQKLLVWGAMAVKADN